jgi:hypothetical protein
MMTANGTVGTPNGNDLRANNFFLGGASRGVNGGVSVDFDYNILGSINSGNQIRVGLRFEDSNGNFLGENNFHLGTPNNDVGGTGWHHFHGVSADPTHAALTADLRLTMNIFGDDIWSSGPVLFDNFVVKETPAIGPTINGNFENGGANWNTGGPGGSAGSETFGIVSNGLSGLGTYCVEMTADGTVGPPNGNDLRVNEYNVANVNDLVTISFDYNILNPITSANQIRVGLRFFDSNNNFTGEHNTYIGTPNGDLGAQGWQHLSATYAVPSAAVQSDIRVSMNVFGDDDWNNGPVLFDNFVVITGTYDEPVSTNVVMGTVTNLPVTRVAVAGGSLEPYSLLEYGYLSTNSAVQPTAGIIESEGMLDYPAVSYVSQPAHGTVTAKGPYLTYTANHGYVGADAFAFAVGDGLGGLSTNAAAVQVNNNAGLNKFTSTVNAGANNYVLSFSGAAQCAYLLESASSLTPPIVWTPVATNQANGSGSVVFTNQQTGTATFWRTQLLP